MPDLPNYLDAHKVAAREVAALAGRARVTYPHDSVAYPKVERVRDDIQLPRTGSAVPLAYGTPDQEYTGCVLTTQTLVGQDDQYAHFYFVWETLPGPVLIAFSRIDPEDGSLITQTKQDVLTSATSPASSSGTTTTSYEARGDSAYVSVKIVTTTALDGVVRSMPVNVSLELPRVLGGIAVSYFSPTADGDDTSTGVAGGSGTRHVSASARSSGSLGVIPEAFPTIRDYTDAAKNVDATVKQVYLSGAITPAAIRAKLTAVYEVVVNGTLSPAAGGTYLGNSSNSQGVNSADGGVLWFSLGTYVLQWQGGNWLLGTRAGIAAGNFWFKAGSISNWLGDYAALGANTGTAHVAVGRTVQAWPTWNTAEVNLITASPQVSVSANASASEEDGTATSLTLSAGRSVSVGGSQGRVRIEPTLHGSITIPNGTYVASVNATAVAAISGLGSTGISSGFPSGTNPNGNRQFATSYVRTNAGAMSTSTFTPAARTISGITVANPTVVTTTTAHGLVTGNAAVITGSDSTPTINGTRAITRLSATTFSVAVNVASVVTGAGTVQGPTATVSASAFIPPTVPEDVPMSGVYELPRSQVSGKDAIYFSVNSVVVDMAAFAAQLGKPISLTYSDPTPTYFQGIAIQANQPAFQGGTPTSYAVSPSLPTGLALDTTTGIITGTPSVGQVATSYTITATNASGAATAVVTISVSI